MSEPSRLIDIACSALPGANARPHCAQCSHEMGYLGRYIKTNGVVAIRWVCSWCENYTTAGDLPRTILPVGIQVDELPLRLDNRADDSPLCVVCDSVEVEYHHWAPTAIFPDWGDVPGTYLCRRHHREWHDRMRAHGLRYPYELARAT